MATLHQNTLFGTVEKLTEPEKLPSGKVRTKTVTNGYAWTPGTGPTGEKCRTCKYILRIQRAKTYRKCSLTRWTNGAATDIKAHSPACKYWEAPEAWKCFRNQKGYCWIIQCDTRNKENGKCEDNT